MTGIQTPPAPPAPPASVPPVAPPADGDGSRPPRRTSARVIAILTMCAGGALVVGTLGGALVTGIRTAGTNTQILTADAAGITDLDIDIDRADFRIAYDDVDEVELSVVGTPAEWRLARDGDELSVSTDRHWWGGWWDDGDRAVLTLPLAYADRGFDASLSLGSGSLTAEGAFGELDVDLSAGAIDVAGSARELDIEVAAGRATLDLADVATGSVEVSAGEVSGRLTGDTPRELGIDVSAGRVDLELPDAAYAVTSDVSAGGFDNLLETSSTASSRVTVTVSAGHVALRPGD